MQRRQWRETGIRKRTFAGVLVLAFACSQSPVAPDPAEAAAAVAEIAAAVTGQEAPMAARYEQEKHLGFDTYTYPGDDVMRKWRTAKDAPYSWVGYYLPAPCHKGKTWVGKRQTLTDMGWGLAVVYVGQQTWEKTPRRISPAQRDALLRRGKTCNADFVSGPQGRMEADDAIAKTAGEGFARGTVIFLDVERMEKVPEAMRDYYRAWTARVLEDGRFRPGYYVHKHNAQLIFDDVTAVFAAAGVKEEPRFWVASARDFDPDEAAPSDVGHAFAGVWQGLIDVAREVADIELPVDVNVAAWPSPSDWEVAE